MAKLDLTQDKWQDIALGADGPTCLVIRAWLEPVGDLDRFQPSGFPEIGHVIYDAPRKDGSREKVCIVDSPASMANHLETVCMDGPTGALHADLANMPYVRCVTDEGGDPSDKNKPSRVVVTSLTEGHRLASDYFLDGQFAFQWKKELKAITKKGKKETEETIPAHWGGDGFRDQLRSEFGIKEIKKDKTYFIWPDTWWNIYKTIFKYDPNSLVHGVMFAKEQIKVSRLLTAHLEAFGISRVGRSGVKFDRLGKTTSGQPIFAVDDETANSIEATFIIDLALLRSYGRDEKGLSDLQKKALLDLTIWKIKRLLQSPFRFRSGCQLACTGIAWCDDTDEAIVPDHPNGKKPENLKVDAKTSISACNRSPSITDVYYPSSELFKVSAADDKPATEAGEADPEETDDE